jgi:hypothetical protein
MVATQAKSIRSVRIVRAEDTDPDLSYIGEWTDKPAPWVIVRRDGDYLNNLEGDDYELPERGREFRFFKPYAGGEPEGSDNYQAYGMADWRRMEAFGRDWWTVGIYAVAEIVVNGIRQEIQSGGLWGIESDSDAAYMRTVAHDELCDLKDVLAQLCFTQEELADAFDGAEDADWSHS